MENDSLKIYMESISHYPLLTTKEEGELAKKIAAGDQAAGDRLAQCNLRLVVKIAHDFKGRGLMLEDLIAEGNAGLLRAVEKFDPTKGAKFSSYAAWWIKQSMHRAIANCNSTVRLPIQTSAKIRKIRDAQRRLAERFGREPTLAEIAEATGLTVRTVKSLLNVNVNMVSLSEPIQSGEDGVVEELLADAHAPAPIHPAEHQEDISNLQHLMGHLDDRERTVLIQRFGLDGNPPKTLEDVSATLGRTRERIRQIQRQALDKLNRLFGEETANGVSVGKVAETASV
jgi:RNA polymerase primary sigma factor